MFEKLEDWFLSLRFVDDTFIERGYFSMCRKWSDFEDFIYYGPKYFIRNFIDYREFLKTNRWFDNYYFFDMLRIKLKTDVKYYKKYGMNVDLQQLTDQMENCIELIDRICEDDYVKNEYENLEKKWGENKFEKSDEYFILNRPKIKTNNDRMEYSKDITKICELETERKTQDIKNLFEILEKNIQGWWD